MRNILAKVPRSMQRDMKQLVKQVFEAPTYEEEEKRARALIARFGQRYSSAIACLAEDLEACHHQFDRAALWRREEADQSDPTLPRGSRLLAVGLRHLGQSVGELAWCADDTGDTAGSGPASSTTDSTTRKGVGGSLEKSSKGRLMPANLQENWDLTSTTGSCLLLHLPASWQVCKKSASNRLLRVLTLR